jgi:hypothetical protein
VPVSRLSQPSELALAGGTFPSAFRLTIAGDFKPGAGVMIEKVNLAQKFSLFTDHYSPKIAGELNDSYVKLVKLQGEFVWHHH